MISSGFIMLTMPMYHENGYNIFPDSGVNNKYR